MLAIFSTSYNQGIWHCENGKWWQKPLDIQLYVTFWSSDVCHSCWDPVSAVKPSLTKSFILSHCVRERIWAMLCNGNTTKIWCGITKFYITITIKLVQSNKGEWSLIVQTHQHHLRKVHTNQTDNISFSSPNLHLMPYGCGSNCKFILFYFIFYVCYSDGYIFC